MERIVRGRSATLSKDFTFTPTGTPSVALTRVSDGSSVTVGAVAGTVDPSVFEYTIPASSNTLLDTYVETWTATSGGAAQTFTDYIEVAGDVLFTVAEFRALGSAYANTTNYPTATVTDMRTTVEQALEDACNVAFVPRYERETVCSDGTTTLRLKWPKIRAVRSGSATYAGTTTTLSAGDLLNLTWDEAGFLGGYMWTLGYPWVVGYEHGWDRPPERIRRAALILAKRWITPGAADDRAINLTNDSGTYALFQAGVRGHTFDVPEVQAAVDAYDLSVGVA